MDNEVKDLYLSFLKTLGKPGQLPKASKSVAECLTPQVVSKAYHWWKKYGEKDSPEQFKSDLKKTIFSSENGLIRNDRGLIYIERAMVLSPENASKLHKKYYSVGECWAYQPGKGTAYCARVMEKDSVSILLKGWVDPSSVNWVETLYISTYHMASEKEIRLSDEEHTTVEVYEIVFNKKALKLPEPYIVRATAEKYSHRPDVVEKLRQETGASANGKHDQHYMSQKLTWSAYKDWRSDLKGAEEGIVKYPPSHGYRIGKKGLEYTLINKAGQQIVDAWWDSIAFTGGLLRVKKGTVPYFTASTKSADRSIKTVGTYNFVNNHGEELLKQWVDSVKEGSGGKIYVDWNGRRYKLTVDQIKAGNVDLHSEQPIKRMTFDIGDDEEVFREEE